MQFYLTQEQIKVCSAIRDLIASRMQIPAAALEKYKKNAFVKEKIVLHFVNGKPDHASFSTFNLGPFTTCQTQEKSVAFEVNNSIAFQRLLDSNENMTFVVDKGYYVYTALAYDVNGQLIGDFGEKDPFGQNN